MTRSDPFMNRARELCTAAGQDPDARVPKEGTSKTMPAWCLYRQAAMDEQVAKEIADVQIGPQDEKYASSPLTIFGVHDDNTIEQMRNCMRVGNVVQAVLCADGHLGYAQPVGGVIAYEGQVSISGVGFDIGCGNLAVQLDTPYSEIRDRVSTILGDIRSNISFGVGRKNETRVEHPLFDDAEAWKASGMEDYRPKAKAQLGTVGSGNHYVDLFRDTAGFVWIGVHFGSRGLGHTTATRYLKMAGGKDGMNVPPTVVNVDSEIGQRYLAGMELAGAYAYAGREWVVDRVRQMIGGNITEVVHNHHNYAWLENHNGRDLWVVRKGATPAFPGQKGFIGGSMGDNAVIVEGVGGKSSKGALYSTIHGAGRVYGRRQALKTLSREQMDTWLRNKGVLLSGGDLDESPMAYRRLNEVLDFHAGTIDIIHTLIPFAVAMAGEGEFDPFKD